MLRPLFTAVTLLTLAGCASTYTWQLPPHPTYGSFSADHQGCLDTANSNWSIPWLYGGGTAIRKASYVRCMERLGYKKLHVGDRRPEDDVATTGVTGVGPR